MDRSISKTDAKLLFKFRTRMYAVKANFSRQYENTNMLCDLCKSSECTQQHLFQCPIIKGFIPEMNSSSVKYEYLFGNTTQMKQVVKMLEKIIEIREQLLQDLK